MPRAELSDIVCAFRSHLGWTVMVGGAGFLKALTFAHASRRAAIDSLDSIVADNARIGSWNPELARRLQAYADGAWDDFRDVRLDLHHLTPFQRRVVNECRHIGYGQTLTYGQLAVKAGSPRAARAVGSVMAANRFPLVVPCHRVVGVNGGLGGYSAGEGVTLKAKLLALEAAYGD
ncbi:MAG: methylated-DNA--[protein]-cysteine S-methyltransferase [Pirellulales bacterium]